jgi:hypothetical protein
MGVQIRQECPVPALGAVPIVRTCVQHFRARVSRMETSKKERPMTFSSLIGSLTGAKREASAPPAGPPASSPDVLGWLEIGTLQFVPAKEEDRTLGGQREVRERIADVLPGVVFDDEGHGAFMRTGYSVAFDTGSDEQVTAVRVQVTGGVAALPPIQRLVTKTGWRVESVN